jgi:hypothetical protein
LAWLVIAQITHWSTPWVAWTSWGLFVLLVLVWVRRAGWSRTIRAVALNPLLTIVAVAAVSALINGGWWSRVADLAAYAVLFAFLLDQKPRLDGAIVGVGWWVIGVTVLEWGYLIQTSGGRVHLLGSPNVVAAVLMIALPAGWQRLRGARRWAWAIAGLLAMWATGSRDGALALLFYVLAARRARWWVWVVLATVAVGALVFMRPGASWARVVYYTDAIRFFVANPVLGVGPGMYRSIVGTVTYYHAHNLILTILAELGILGLAGLAGALALGRLVRPGGQHRTQDGLARLVAMLPFFLFDDMTMYWGVALGTLYLLSKVSTTGKMPLLFDGGGDRIET